MRRLAAALVVLLALGAAGAYRTGAWSEVVVVRTFDAEGTPHDTRTWVIDVAGVPWVRVGSPRRAWYRRLLAQPRVELVRGGRRELRLAQPSDDPTVRRAVDEAFAAKYGPAGAWAGLLLRRDPVPIRLAPASDDVASPAPAAAR